MTTEEFRDEAEMEVTLMVLNNEGSQNIKFIEAFESEKFVFIVIEYMDCGCLTKLLIESQTNYPERMV